MKTVLFNSYAQGMPSADNFSIREEPQPVLSEAGSFLVKILYVSVDPYMRVRMNPVTPIYTTPFQVGQPIDGFLVGEIIETKNEKYGVGTFVTTIGNFSEFLILNESAPLFAKVALDRSDLSHALGACGMTGLTAYFGLLDLGQPKAGQTLVVSGAAGAVGTDVVQLGKLHGCHVIGIAGSDEKCKILKEELGCDVTINYKTDNVLQKLKEGAPNKVDLYFDNVGGEISDLVLSWMNVKGVVMACGAISEYNNTTPDVGPRPWIHIIAKGLRVQGFVAFRDYGSRWQEGTDYMTKLFTEHKIKAKESVVQGIEKVPEGLINLLTGANIGKQVVKF